MIPYRLVRSKRKTLSLQITGGGEVLVRAPLRCSKQYIDEFVESKESWIISHREKMLKMQHQQAVFRPLQQKTMGFCGQNLQVKRSDDNSVRLNLDQMEISLPDLSVGQLLPAVEKVYKKAGLPFLQQRTEYWSKIMGISYNSVRFSSALKRWGSCSSRGDIRITWMALFAPLRAIDYILVHELSHRVEFNHSKAFWDVVRRYMPDYETQKKVLKNLSEELYSQGWSKKYN